MIIALQPRSRLPFAWYLTSYVCFLGLSPFAARLVPASKGPLIAQLAVVTFMDYITVLSPYVLWPPTALWKFYVGMLLHATAQTFRFSPKQLRSIGIAVDAYACALLLGSYMSSKWLQKATCWLLCQRLTSACRL